MGEDVSLIWFLADRYTYSSHPSDHLPNFSQTFLQVKM